MPEAVIIHLTPKPGRYAELTKLVKEMVEQVRNYPGCLQAETLLAPDREEVAVYQRWSSGEALSDYLIWRSRQEDFERVHDICASEPDFKSFMLSAAK